MRSHTILHLYGALLSAAVTAPSDKGEMKGPEKFAEHESESRSVITRPARRNKSDRKRDKRSRWT